MQSIGITSTSTGWLAAFFCLALTACQGAGNPRFDSEFVGGPSADFFLEYGPPSDVITYKTIPQWANPRNYPRGDQKQLVYYWSSINRRTMTEEKNPLPLRDECNLAILTRSDGQILRMEVQSDSRPIAEVKTYCETVVD